MKRNCNLELRLMTPSVLSSDYNCCQSQSRSMLNGDDRHMVKLGSPKDEEKMKKMTIFYNGKVAAFDVTELQARVIILLARREIEDRKWSPSPRSDPTSPLLKSPMYYSPTPGLSMKRSLQSFLQKRKTRVQATSPYPILTPRKIIHHHNSSKNC